jgi:hypothetical protein
MSDRCSSGSPRIEQRSHDDRPPKSTAPRIRGEEAVSLTGDSDWNGHPAPLGGIGINSSDCVDRTDS